MDMICQQRTISEASNDPFFEGLVFRKFVVKGKKIKVSVAETD